MANFTDVAGGVIGGAAEAYAYAVTELSEREIVAVIRKNRILGGGRKNICFAENRTYDTVFVIHCNKDS